MKNKYAYLLVLGALIAALLAFIYSDVIGDRIAAWSTPVAESPGSKPVQENPGLNSLKNAADSKDSAPPQNTGDADEREKNTASSEHFFLQGLSKFAFDISRELCVQEQNLLIQTLESPDSKHRPRANELISLLKKTANSKCSSFRRNNAQELFFKFKLDESNYKSFLKNFSLVLGDYQGMLPLKLMRASMQELEQAKPEEIKPLREAIIYSLSTTINDSSAFIDVGVSVAMLKELSEKGLISGPTLSEIDTFMEEFKEAMQRQRKINNESRKNHDYPVDKMVDYLDFDDAKIELKLIQDEYQTVELFRNRLIGFMERSFK